MIPAQWTTKRLLVEDSRESDLPHLMSVHLSCTPILHMDPRFKAPTKSSIQSHIRFKFGGHMDRKVFRYQTVRDMELERRVVGVIQLLHGRPAPSVVSLSLIAIEARSWRRGYGKELFQGLLGEVAKLPDYDRIWLEAYKSNIPALLFWQHLGFNRMVVEKKSVFVYEWMAVSPEPEAPAEKAEPGEGETR